MMNFDFNNKNNLFIENYFYSYDFLFVFDFKLGRNNNIYRIDINLIYN